MAIAIEKLEDQLNCSICLETYSSPKLLKCNHVYCQQCLIKLVNQDQLRQLSLTCPNCRQITPVPASGVASLPAAFHVNQLLEIVKKAKATSSLKMVGGSQVVCPEHCGREVKLYCETCRVAICIKCIKKSEKHHNHDYEELDEAFERYKEEITSSLEPMEKQLMGIKNALAQLDICHDKISNQQAAIEADIYSTFTRLHETLDIRKTELISQLHQLTQAKLKHLAVQKEQLETTQAQLNSCLLLVREKFSQGEALLMKNTAVRQVKELSAMFQLDALEPNADADMIFSASSNLSAECQNYGKVYTIGSPDPSKCCIAGKGIGTVGEKSTAIIRTLDSDNQPCKVPLSSISCQLLSEITGTKIGVNIEKRGQNQYEMSYQPSIKGRHYIHVKVKGQHIGGSPFPFIAESPVENLSTPILTIDVQVPSGVAVNQMGAVIVTEFNKHQVVMYSPSGMRLRAFGTCGSGPGQFQCPAGVAVDGQGNILVADCSNHRIQKFTAQGEFLTAIGTEGSGFLQFQMPRSIAVNASNGRVYVASSNRIQILNQDLSYFGAFGETGRSKGQFSDPRQLAFDCTGNVYVTESDNHRIQVFTAEGKFLRMFGRCGEGKGDLYEPWGLAIDLANRLYVSELGSHRVSVFTTEGEFVMSFKTGGSVGRLAVDSGVLYVCGVSYSCVELY